MLRNRLATALAVMALVLGGATACGGGSSSNNSATIMVGGLDKQIYLPFMLAKQLGFYTQQGLSVTLSDEPAGVDATTAMLAGQVAGTGGFYDHTIDVQGKGKAVEAVVQMLQVPGEVELCRNDLKSQIKSPADWKGRTLGVTDLGSSTDFLTQYLAVKNGLSASDIHRSGVQAGPTLIAAMDHKSIDCAMTTEPTVSELLSTNRAYIIADMRTAAGAKQALGGTYPATSLYMQTSYVNSHRQTVQKLVNAYVKTLEWIQSHSADQITAMMPPDYYAGVGKTAYSAALQSEKGIYDPNGLMPPDGPQTVVKVQNAFNPDVKGMPINLGATYTNSFVTTALANHV